jgi:hypothetical protein
MVPTEQPAALIRNKSNTNNKRRIQTKRPPGDLSGRLFTINSPLSRIEAIVQKTSSNYFDIGSNLVVPTNVYKPLQVIVFEGAFWFEVFLFEIDFLVYVCAFVN